MRWIHTPLPADEIENLERSLGVSPVLAELLLRSGLRDGAAAARHLRPTLAELEDPFALANLEAASARIARALEAHEEIMVLGDYDVDGVSSTALLVSVLRRLGSRPRFVVPRRAEDGYGLSRSAIDRALETGPHPGLFIALDCGTNAHDEVGYLVGKGIDVLVIDHHRCKEATLAEGILINPHVGLDLPADGRHDLCTVGLVFKLVHGLIKRLRSGAPSVAHEIRLRDYLDLVALGTVADLVPLRGENRIMARHGLRIMQDQPRIGLRALMDVAGIRPGQDLVPLDISYRLGPRINASGRLADAAISVELLLSDDPAFSAEVALQLDAFNRERQGIERRITEEAEKMVENRFASAAGLVLYGEDWHPGVVGIVAGRVSRKFNRPCVVLGNEGEFAKGSGRSVGGVNLVEVLGTCSRHLAGWGGHPMAVGVALPKTSLEAFRDSFASAVESETGGEPLVADLTISAWLNPSQVESALLGELAELHPFGQGNPEPVFGLREVVLPRAPEVFKEQHFRFVIDATPGRRVFGVAWRMANRTPPAGVPLDLAVELKWNHFNGRKYLQLVLVDWRPAESVDTASGK